MADISPTTGVEYGRLTVLGEVSRRDASGKVRRFLECRCKCGEIREFRKDVILSGRATSCGCYHKEVASVLGKATALLLEGRVFGRLTVVRRHGTKRRKSTWLCQCECGEEKTVLSTSLTSGKTTSCGCYRSEMAAERRFNPSISDEERELSSNRDLNPRNVEWRKAVYERDGYSCTVCEDDRGGNLVAHHKDGYHWCKDRRYEVGNGATACSDCHGEFHHLYGPADNTEEQWAEFCSKSRRERPLRIEKASIELGMVGRVFGFLTVMKRDGRAADGHASFLCRCECGNEKKVVGSSLRKGVTKSCGCKKGLLISESKRAA